MSSKRPAELEDSVLYRKNCGEGAFDAIDDRGDALPKKELDLDSVLNRRPVVRGSDISEELVRPVATEGQVEKTESLIVMLVVVAVEPLLSSFMRGSWHDVTAWG